MCHQANQPIILHTAKSSLNGETVKILIDQGSDASICTAKFKRRLNLETKVSGETLNIQTLSGNTQQCTETAQIEITKEVTLDVFVVDTNLKLEPQPLDLKAIWPSMAKELMKEVAQNMIDQKTAHV